MFTRFPAGWISAWILSGAVFAQAPTASIRGLVTDASQAAIPNVSLTVTSDQTGVYRTVKSNGFGEFLIPALAPGSYLVRAQAAGFRPKSSSAELLVGRELTLNFTLEVGSEKQVVLVEGQVSQVNTTEFKVEGVISRAQIKDLPLNGRNALELARLQPGILISSGVPSGKNGFVGVSIGGETSAATRVTIDGGSVVDMVTGGSEQNFSQEVVQEFQVSVGNFDISTGITASGAVNLVTRSGSNDLHGAGFLYWRDSSFAANPALTRNPVVPEPKFDREQYGYLASGPVIHDRIFWLSSIDRTRQRGVNPFIANNLDFSAFNVIKKEPFDVLLQTHKLDWNLGRNHRMNFRYSRDGNQGRAGGGLPENQRVNTNHADQYLLNWTAVLNPRMVSDARIQFQKYSNYYTPTPEAFAQGIPRVSINQSNVTFGLDDNSPQSTLNGRLEMSDTLSQQLGRHSFKYGFDFERARGRGTWQLRYPASITLYSPTQARLAGISIPAAFTTRSDLLQLPVAGFTFGYGNAEQPPFRPDQAAVNHRARFFSGDSWKIAKNFTLNLGIAYSFEDNLVNWDLNKPASLAKVLHGATQPSRRDWNNWAPQFGFAWSPGAGSKTVVRGGFGIYYDTLQLNVRLIERTQLAPAGVGFPIVSQDIIPDPTSPGRTLNYLPMAPSNFRGADLLRYLAQIRAPFDAQAAVSQKSQDLSVRNVEVNRGNGGNLLDPFLTTPYSMHYTLGIQRELPHSLLVSLDGEFKQTVHEVMSADYNRYQDVRGSVDPAYQAVTFYQTGATAQYKAMLVTLQKRYAKRYQFLASYALASFVGLNGSGLFLGSGVSDKENWRDAFGPQGSDRRHRFVFSGTLDLPWRFQVSAISEATSRGPANLTGGNYDYNGDGTRGDRIPGTTQNQMYRGIWESDLGNIVAQFNQQYAGRKDAQGQVIKALPPLPTHYHLSAPAISQDLRVTKVFKLGERFQASAIGEVFNIFNLANLGGFSGDLSSLTFGQPTGRSSNVFGSGGPRAFQFALRFNF
jgi:hypothetical protein